MAAIAIGPRGSNLPVILQPFRISVGLYFCKKNYNKNCSHQMSYFKAKMHQNRFFLGPDGELERSQTP